MFSLGKWISSTLEWIIAELWTGHQRHQRMEVSFFPVAHPGLSDYHQEILSLEYHVEQPYLTKVFVAHGIS